MKRKLILAAVALIIAGSAGLFAAKPSVEQQQQLAAAMKTLVENRNYSVRVQQASGVKGGGIATNSLLKVNGETAYSSMPYWGGGYNNFGNNDGMRFNGTISDYTVTVDKKNKVWVTFKVTTDTKRVYQIRMEIFYNRKTLISASCPSLDPMRYDGVIGISDGVDNEAH